VAQSDIQGRGGSRSILKSKQTVITIHGVNPDRTWQSKVHGVLGPHFDAIGYDYADYDTWLGPVKAIVNLPTFILSLLTIATPAILVRPWQFAVPLIGIGLLLLLASFLLGWRARSKSAQRLKLYLDEKAPAGRPHLIAHSLGTYLIGRTLKKFPDVRLENLILVSTVLPRHFPWKSVLGEMPPKVRRVRSEFGRSDPVVRAVGWISWLVRDLGNAGLYGFHNAENWVHTSLSPVQACLDCIPRYSPVPVHNVPLGEFRHSDQFLSPKHAQTLWLPFLWNIEPNELFSFLDSSHEISRLEIEERYYEADKIIGTVWAKSYSWTYGRPLTVFVEDTIIAWQAREAALRKVSAANLVQVVKARLHTVVELAVEELSTSAQEKNEWNARALHPAIAIARAIRGIVIDETR
jgi:pimeloyl-ACP methyl ester carboxylesterase